MRTLCDVCEGAAAILFCAADEAALCRSCDDRVHMCNKLASRHVRVGLAEPSAVPPCDICESAPAFFFCEIDGSSLCLQCDINVHVGGKRTHGRYLLMRQRVEFPGDKAGSPEGGASQRMHLSEAKKEPAQVSGLRLNENQQNFQFSPQRSSAGNVNINNNGEIANNLIDLNTRPPRTHTQDQSNQEQRSTEEQ